MIRFTLLLLTLFSIPGVSHGQVEYKDHIKNALNQAYEQCSFSAPSSSNMRNSYCAGVLHTAELLWPNTQYNSNSPTVCTNGVVGAPAIERMVRVLDLLKKESETRQFSIIIPDNWNPSRSRDFILLSWVLSFPCD
jgi:hypothetical protein